MDGEAKGDVDPTIPCWPSGVEVLKTDDASGVSSADREAKGDVEPPDLDWTLRRCPPLCLASS